MGGWRRDLVLPVLGSVVVVASVACGRIELRGHEREDFGAAGGDVLVVEFGGAERPLLRDALAERGLLERRDPGAERPSDPIRAEPPQARDSDSSDSGTSDPNTRDSGTRDSGSSDSGARGSDSRDAGSGDAGSGDSGSRSGPVEPRRLQLQAGDTLSELCARELGSARFWRRVAAFNGWSDRDTLRLRPGTWVKVPPDLGR